MTTLERNIARVRACAAQRLWRQMLMGITADQRDWLEALLCRPGARGKARWTACATALCCKARRSWPALWRRGAAW